MAQANKFTGFLFGQDFASESEEKQGIPAPLQKGFKVVDEQMEWLDGQIDMFKHTLEGFVFWENVTSSLNMTFR